MASQASGLKNETVSSREASTYAPPSKLKTYGFVIAIIVGIGGLAIGGVGAAGYFHIGALSNISQINAIIMMAAGGGGGMILLLVGMIGTVKNRKAGSRQLSKSVHEDTQTPLRNQDQQKIQEIISSVNTQGGLVYGPEAWPAFGVKWRRRIEIMDKKIPEASKKNVQAGRVRLYIPERIKLDGEEIDFTLNTLIEIVGGEKGPLWDCSQWVKKDFGNATSPGWIEIDTNVIPGSQDQDYDTQKQSIQSKDNSDDLPNVLEAAVLLLLVHAFKGKRLLPDVCTRCSQKVNDQSPVLVGLFGDYGFHIYQASSTSKASAIARRRI